MLEGLAIGVLIGWVAALLILTVNQNELFAATEKLLKKVRVYLNEVKQRWKP